MARRELPCRIFFLGTRDLYTRFEHLKDSKGRSEGWTLALMEMLVDPMLRQWVPAWVIEQYERQNPFFKEVLTLLQEENLDRNKTLLKRTKREMIRTHELHKKRAAQSEKENASDSESDRGGSENESGDEDALDDAETAAKLASAQDEDEPEGGGRVEMLREPRPQGGVAGALVESDADWSRRAAEEHLRLVRLCRLLRSSAG